MSSHPRVASCHLDLRTWMKYHLYPAYFYTALEENRKLRGWAKMMVDWKYSKDTSLSSFQIVFSTQQGVCLGCGTSLKAVRSIIDDPE